MKTTWRRGAVWLGWFVGALGLLGWAGGRAAAEPVSGRAREGDPAASAGAGHDHGMCLDQAEWEELVARARAGGGCPLCPPEPDGETAERWRQLFLEPDGEIPTAAASGAELFAEYQANPHDHLLLPGNAYAGYHRGEQPLPEVPVVADVIAYGAVGDGATDCTQAFELAIYEAYQRGGGAVWIPAGNYRIEKFILLHRSGVVLRGAGPGQTTLTFANHLSTLLGPNNLGSSSKWNWSGGLIWMAPEAPTFTKPWNDLYRYFAVPPSGYNTGGPGQSWEYWHPGAVQAAVTSTHARGEWVVTVDESRDLRPGELYLMTWENTADDSFYREICQHPLMQSENNFGSWPEDLTNQLRWQWPVEIRAIQGNQVTLAQPLRVAIRPEWQVRFWALPNRVEECGVESLTIQLAARATMGHNAGYGWNAIYANQAWNCWVRDVEVRDAECGFQNSAAKNLTYRDVRTVGTSAYHHPVNARCMTHDVLFDGFTIESTQQVMHGISTEWMSTGNVWTRGRMKGTFDSHRAMSFDVLRTDITLDNDRDSWPGGASQAGYYTARRAVHWNVRVENCNRPAAEWGLYVFQPRQFVYGANVGIQGAPLLASNGVAMPAADLGTAVLDAGVVPTPANLYDAQQAERRATEPWVVLTGLRGPVVAPGPTTLAAEVNPAGNTVGEVRFRVDGVLGGTASVAPYEVPWTALAGVRTVTLEVVWTEGGSAHSRPYPLVVGERRVLQEDDPGLVYTGSWSSISTAPGDYTRFYGGAAKRSGQDGATFTHTFYGTRIKFYAGDWSDNSQTPVIYLDDLTRPVATPNYRSKFWYLVYDSGDLPLGTHTLRVVKQGESLVLDWLEVTRVSEAGPLAVLQATPTAGPVPLSVHFSATSSTAPAGRTLEEYAWDFDNDGTVDALGATVDHTYAVPGFYRARLTVTDSAGFPDTKFVDLAAGTAPTVSLTAPESGTVLVTPASLTLTASASDSDGAVVRVEFFEGATLLGEDTDGTDGWSLPWQTDVYTTYTFTARATDDIGMTATSASVTLTVIPPGQAPYGGSAHSLPGRIQAEDYDVGGPGVAFQDSDPANQGGGYRPEAVDLGPTSDPLGGGYQVQAIVAGEWLEFTVEAATAGTRVAAFRTAAAGSGGTLRLRRDDLDLTGAVAIPVTGGGQSWTTVTSPPFFLPAGPAVLRVEFPAGGFNLNFLEILTPADNQPPTCQISSPGPAETILAPASVTVTAAATDPDGHVARVEFFAGATRLGEDLVGADGWSFLWPNLVEGTYEVFARAHDQAGATADSPTRVLHLVPNSPGGTGAFLESGGWLVLEAENYTGRSPRSDNTVFVEATNAAGYIGRGHIETPFLSGPNGWDISCEVSYDAVFATAGTYQVWVRRWAQDTGRNSIFHGLDGVQSSGQDNDNSAPFSTWIWKKLGSVAVSAGPHTFQLRRREYAYKVDRLVLTTDAGYTPANSGPPESARASNAFLDWLAAPAFGLPADQRDGLDDPDGDGLPNLLEYFLDLHPALATDVALAPSLDESPADQPLRLRFRRRSDAPGLTYAVEWSDDPADPASWNSVGVVEETVSEDGSHQVRLASIPRSTVPRFVRLHVVRP